MTSYKVMVSNDSHTWRTVRNGSEDMVSVSCGIYIQTGRDCRCVNWLRISASCLLCLCVIGASWKRGSSSSSITSEDLDLLFVFLA